MDSIITANINSTNTHDNNNFDDNKNIDDLYKKVANYIKLFELSIEKINPVHLDDNSSLFFCPGIHKKKLNTDFISNKNINFNEEDNDLNKFIESESCNIYTIKKAPQIHVLIAEKWDIIKIIM